jgi:hypothetical protein
MLKVRLAIVGAAVALALGAAGALAMENATGSDPDAHGDAVSSAARFTCPHGEGHGACVSAVAQSQGEAKETDDAQRDAAVAACKAQEKSKDKPEDLTEKSTKGADKAAKKADHAEDKSEHKTFKACISGSTSAGTGG